MTRRSRATNSDTLVLSFFFICSWAISVSLSQVKSFHTQNTTSQRWMRPPWMQPVTSRHYQIDIDMMDVHVHLNTVWTSSLLASPVPSSYPPRTSFSKQQALKGMRPKSIQHRTYEDRQEKRKEHVKDRMGSTSTVEFNLKNICLRSFLASTCWKR